VIFDGVWKKFERGERKDSLRDLIPHVLNSMLRRKSADLSDREFWALRDVSFEVYPGEALGIIGANGAGKSTTLKLLTRILRPNAGRAQVGGRVGALIEVAAGFHPDLTGRENVYLQGAIMGMRRAEISARFDEIVEFAGVTSFIDTPVKRYSSGMNARLGFSIAAHLDPDTLIIDEVLSVGDMAFQHKCFDRMLDYKRKGAAIVVVSHNLQAISRLCDRCVYLHGEVRAYGDTSSVLEKYVQNSMSVATMQSSEALQVRRIRLEREDGSLISGQEPLEAGDALHLKLSLHTGAPLEGVTFGLVVHRSTDQLVVYDGNVHKSETSATLEGSFELEFRFIVNLVRGHYYVSFHITDDQSQSNILKVSPLATFVVHEARSYGGVADLRLELLGNVSTARESARRAASLL
jgi:lipopolysaccharide transport system ATP-binding protein